MGEKATVLILPFNPTPKNTETFALGADQIITVTHDGGKQVVQHMKGLMHDMELSCFVHDPTQLKRCFLRLRNATRDDPFTLKITTDCMTAVLLDYFAFKICLLTPINGLGFTSGSSKQLWEQMKLLHVLQSLRDEVTDEVFHK